MIFFQNQARSQLQLRFLFRQTQIHYKSRGLLQPRHVLLITISLNIKLLIWISATQRLAQGLGLAKLRKLPSLLLVCMLIRRTQCLFRLTILQVQQKTMNLQRLHRRVRYQYSAFVIRKHNLFLAGKGHLLAHNLYILQYDSRFVTSSITCWSALVHLFDTFYLLYASIHSY